MCRSAIWCGSRTRIQRACETPSACTVQRLLSGIRQSRKVTGILGERWNILAALWQPVVRETGLVGTQGAEHQEHALLPIRIRPADHGLDALDDTKHGDGCVRFSAGSHKLGMLPSRAVEVQRQLARLVDHPGVNALPEHAVEVKRGSLCCTTR